MTLSDAAKSAGYEGPKLACKFGDILSRLDADDLAFYEQMKTDQATFADIGKVFRADGKQVSDSVVRRHMGGSCSCP